MRETVVKILGSQRYSTGEHGEMEMILEAQIYEKGSSTYVLYSERDDESLKEIKSTLKIDGDYVKISRRCDGHLIGNMEFQKNSRKSSKYTTPVGDMILDIYTSNLENSFGNGEKGRLVIEYELSMRGFVNSNNKIIVEEI